MHVINLPVHFTRPEDYEKIMNTTPKDQAARKHHIALLETVIAKNAAAIEHTELTHKRQLEKQINRLAELRMQKLLLLNAERAATKINQQPK